MARVLVVDDETAMLDVLEHGLSSDGHHVLRAESGAAAMRMAREDSPDLVILDLRLPDTDGMEVTRSMRRWFSAPILILSGYADEQLKIQALDSGADDYLPKPFSMGELRARLRALLRRAVDISDATLQYRDLRIDLAAGAVVVRGEEVRLTKTEWALLQVLATSPGKLLTHRRLASLVWGEGYGDEMRQTLRGHVKALRHKLQDDASDPIYVRTESGAGYRWIADPQADAPTPSAASSGAGLGAEPATVIHTAVDRDRMHDLNNAISVLVFTLESSLDLHASVTPEDRTRLGDQLVRAQKAAHRAQKLAIDISAQNRGEQ